MRVLYRRSGGGLSDRDPGVGRTLSRRVRPGGERRKEMDACVGAALGPSLAGKWTHARLSQEG